MRTEMRRADQGILILMKHQCVPTGKENSKPAWLPEQYTGYLCLILFYRYGTWFNGMHSQYRKKCTNDTYR